MTPSELNFTGKRRLPVIVAAEAAECGLACLAMIGRHHGHDIDLNGLRQRFSLSIAGTSLRGLMALADQLGLGARALRAELEALGKIRLPAVLHWDLNHFVVLAEVGRDHVVIHDPAFGRRKMPLAEASKHFTGVALELSPVAGFESITARAKVKLSSLWSQIKGFGPALAQVMALSLVLQVCAFALPFQIQLVVDDALSHGDRDLLAVIAVGFGAVVLLQAAVEAFRSWSLQVSGSLLTFQIVGNLVRHMLRLPSDFFEKRHVGDILSRIGSTSAIQDALTRGVVSALIDGLMAIVAAVALFVYSPTLAIIVIVSLALILATAWATYPAIRAATEEKLLAEAREQSHLMESVRAATTIKLMGREVEREGSWRNLYAGVVNATVKVGRFQVSLTFAQQAIVGLQTVLVIYFGARAILAADGLSVGMLLAFLSFRQTFTDRALNLVTQATQFRLLALHLERLGDIITAPAETTSEPAPQLAIRGEIALKQASFRYGASDPLILDAADLKIEPGEFVAITGPSGAGKSTLLKILLGLQAPTDGAFELEGRRASPALIREWRRHVGVVAQDDRLLSGSIADNIAFFDPDLDMQRVQAAAMAAQVHEEIARAPMQYQTLIGDMGSSLSGGQRQRILLARALYRKPRILVLDEGTANLDEATEEVIGDLITQLPMTRIVVAHRPALLRRAQRVLRVEGGRIVEIRGPNARPQEVEAAEAA